MARPIVGIYLFCKTDVKMHKCKNTDNYFCGNSLLNNNNHQCYIFNFVWFPKHEMSYKYEFLIFALERQSKVLFKGGLISEVIFTLVPSSKGCAKSFPKSLYLLNFPTSSSDSNSCLSWKPLGNKGTPTLLVIIVHCCHLTNFLMRAQISTQFARTRKTRF